MSTCSTCAPTFDVVNLLTWTYRGQPAPMLPTCQADLERLLDPAPLTSARPRLRIGDPVRIRLPGREDDGMVGTLLKRGRTRYHLEVGNQVVTVPFARVGPAAATTQR